MSDIIRVPRRMWEISHCLSNVIRQTMPPQRATDLVMKGYIFTTKRQCVGLRIKMPTNPQSVECVAYSKKDYSPLTLPIVRIRFSNKLPIVHTLYVSRE